MNYFHVSCPACGKEMEPGWLYGGRGILFWSPTPDKRTILRGREDVPLAREGPPAAFLCRACRRVLFEY